MDERTKEYVESAKSADVLEQKVQALSEAIGLDGPGEVGAKYIEHSIVNNGTLDYQVFPSDGKAHYCVIDEMTPNATTGSSGGLGVGPITRLRENGFIVKETKAYLGARNIILKHYNEQLPDEYVATYIKYVGAEHPIIEYWDE